MERQQLYILCKSHSARQLYWNKESVQNDKQKWNKDNWNNTRPYEWSIIYVLALRLNIQLITFF